MRVEPATARYAVEQTDSLLRIKIPARSHIGLKLIWAGWFFAMGAAAVVPGGWLSRMGQHGTDWIAVIIWSVLMLTGAASILWLTLGSEEITIADNMLVARMSIGPIGYSRKYAFPETNSYRISLKYAAWCGSYKAYGLPAGQGRGTIHFEYRGDTQYLGAGLDETEANHVFALLKPLVDSRPRRARSSA